jgi:hypothetical protein
MQNYVSELRRLLPAGALPLNAARKGYRLSDDVEVDWRCFDRRVATAAAKVGDDRLVLLGEALSFVRGEPLAGWTSWDFAVGESHRMTAVIERVSHELATARLAGGDPTAAEAAIEAGLRGAPSSPLLWDDRLVIAGAGGPLTPTQVWSEARGQLGDDGFAVLEQTHRARSAAEPLA